jgi:hypothetical protein
MKDVGSVGPREGDLMQPNVLMASSLLPRAASALRRVHPGDQELIRARGYVATDEISGRTQLELLRREGLTPSSDIIEIGCGTRRSTPAISRT